MTPYNEQVLREQIACLAAANAGKLSMEIAEETGLSIHQVKRRLAGARKRERLDPELADQLAKRGITDLAGLHSGWLMEKGETGSGHSLYFYLGPDEDKISFADAVIEALGDIPRLLPIAPPASPDFHTQAKDHATWLALADLHVGADYGNDGYEALFLKVIDNLIARLPPAEHAVLFELGDLLDANDHKGVTPKSGNMLDVKRRDQLTYTRTAIRMMKWAMYRLLETHQTVEVHFIKGNHDETAHFAVLLALSEHFADNPRIKFVITDAEFRVVSWGLCAAFPHHGDTLNWVQLKDVFSDEFADEWAVAKAHRLIMTAHFHHDRRRDLVGATGEHYRTTQAPSDWARSRGFLSRGSLTAMTVHKTDGEQFRTIANVRSFQTPA